MPDSIFLQRLASGATIAEGAGGATAVIGGVLDLSMAQTATGNNTNETDLYTYAMPGNTMDTNGKGLRVSLWGNYAANGNTKTLKVYFGSTSLTVASAITGNNATWFVQFEVVRLTATTQLMFSQYRDNAAAGNLSILRATPSETLSGAVTVKLTGTNGSASANDIVASYKYIEALN